VTAPARLVVDFIACDGRGLCAEALPDLITLDDWGGSSRRARIRGARDGAAGAAADSAGGHRLVHGEETDPRDTDHAHRGRQGHPVISRTYPFHDIAEAVSYHEQGHVPER
jgi:hypothetical protein